MLFTRTLLLLPLVMTQDPILVITNIKAVTKIKQTQECSMTVLKAEVKTGKDLLQNSANKLVKLSNSLPSKTVMLVPAVMYLAENIKMAPTKLSTGHALIILNVMEKLLDMEGL